LIIVNALRASGQLAAKNRAADLAPLRAAVEKLLTSNLDPGIPQKAKEVLAEIDARSAPVEAR
jgi:hypothetical protein